MSDELLPDAKRLVIEEGKASTSLLQRHFRIGYARAVHLIDELERERVIGPAHGAAPRKVLQQPAPIEKTGDLFA
jgi:S-DNA-T family DNA segregation ATPase FtsK/SpoIIIE